VSPSRKARWIAKETPEPPSVSKGYLPASHAERWGTDLRVLARGAWFALHTSKQTWEMFGRNAWQSRGNGRREVEGDVRSSGVPVGVVECKKHRESSLKTPWHWGLWSPQRVISTFGSVTRRVGISIAEGARES